MYLESVAILPQLHMFKKDRVCHKEEVSLLDGRD